MLSIAFIVLAVLLVLFGVCAFALIRSGSGYDEEPEESQPVADEPRPKRKRQAPDAAASDEKSKPWKTVAAEINDDVKLKPVKAEDEKPAADINDTDQTKRISLPSEAPTGDMDATRVVTKAEMAQIKAAAATVEPPIPTGAVKIAEEPPIEDKDADKDEGGINLVPIIVIGVAALLALGAAAFMLVRNDMKRADDTVDEPQTITATVDNIRQETVYTGSIESESPETRHFSASGQVTKVLVKEGDRVSQDDVLYVLDSSALEERISLLRQRLENATETTERTVEEEVNVTAPSGGTVSSLATRAGRSIREGDLIATLSTVTDYRVTLTFDADETGEITSGDKATVSVGSSSFDGTVTSAVKESVENPDGGSTSTYRATISFRADSLVSENAGARIGSVRSLGTARIIPGSRTNTEIRAGQSGRLSDLRINEGDTVSQGATVAVIIATNTVTETTTDELQARDLDLQIQQLENELQNYTVTAGFDGYVSRLFVKEGENAAVNMQAAIVIPDGSLYLSVHMGEEAKDVRLPTAARFKLVYTTNSGVPDEVWARVSTETEYSGALDSYKQDDSEKGRYNGHVALENQSELYAGMTAQVNVVTYLHYDALLLPAELVKDGKVSIWRANRIDEIKVETGITTDDGYVEIVNGLTGIDRVVAGETNSEE